MLTCPVFFFAVITLMPEFEWVHIVSVISYSLIAVFLWHVARCRCEIKSKCINRYLKNRCFTFAFYYGRQGYKFTGFSLNFKNTKNRSC